MRAARAAQQLEEAGIDGPRRLQGVTLYREEDRAFAVGDRVQLTAPNRERHLANRELGTIEQMQAKGELHLRLDSDRTVALNLREHPHLDYGYAVTSHSSQGQTAGGPRAHRPGASRRTARESAAGVRRGLSRPV